MIEIERNIYNSCTSLIKTPFITLSFQIHRITQSLPPYIPAIPHEIIDDLCDGVTSAQSELLL